MTWRVHCRRPAAGAKGDVGHLRFPMSPLDTPLTFRWPLSKAFAAKRGLRGLGSVRRGAYGTLYCPEFTLRSSPRITVRGHPVQNAHPVAAKSSASIKGVPLEHQTPLWAPRVLDARPKGVASKGGSGVSRGEREPLVPCPLLSPPGDPGTLRRRTAAMPRHVMANIPPPGRAILASSGAPLYRRR